MAWNLDILHKYRKRKEALTLYDVYANPSQKKRELWSEICGYASAFNSSPFIISHNTYTFTAGFVYFKDTEKYFVVITPSTRTSYKVPEFAR